MAGALRKTMVYLGLAEEDDRYDGYDLYEDDVEEAAPVEEAVERRAPVTPISQRHARVVAVPEVREVQRITTIHPRTYNEAKTIGEAFRAGMPVIMNLGEMDDADAKRLVDFAAGLVFGLYGSIERVTNKVFLLSPADVEVSPADKVKLPERGERGERAFFNQS